MMQEIGFAFVGVGVAGLVVIVAFHVVSALRGDASTPAPVRIIEKNLLRTADLSLPAQRAASRPAATAQPPVADELFSELFALRAEVAALTEDVRSIRKQLDGASEAEVSVSGLLAGPPHAAA
jgi:hypothetical protein